MGSSIFQRLLGAADFLRARTIAKDSVSSQRKAAVHFVERGVGLYNARKYTEAADQFRQAIDEDPVYARAHCYLGTALHKLGVSEEAVMEWKKAVILEPGSDSAAKAQRKLNKIAAHNAAITRSLEEDLGIFDD
jgi:Tfp pilus assembly protein PilF